MNLEELFELRKSFMQEIETRIPGTYPENAPITEPSTQKIVREITLRGVEEIFEALQHLKGWKNHRSDVDCTVDEDEFLEEIVDAFNYFFSLMILANITPTKFEKAFRSKDEKIRNRIRNL
jgi:hypothetical protein